MRFQSYNGGDGELLLSGVLEESKDIIANDDARLAAQNISDTHIVAVNVDAKVGGRNLEEKTR